MGNTTCRICGKVLTTPGNLKKHVQGVHKEELNPNRECACGVRFKSSQSLNAHYRHCLIHRNGLAPIPPGNKGLVSPNKGKKLEEIVANPEETRKRLTESLKRRGPLSWREDPDKVALWKQRCSESHLKLHEEHPIIYGGYCLWHEVDGKLVQGTMERDFAIKLVSLGIPWVKKVKDGNSPLHYLDSNRNGHWYTPDFYLPEENLQVETKGYWWPGHLSKMQRVLEQNPDCRICIAEGIGFDRMIGAQDREEFFSIIKEHLNVLPKLKEP